MKTDQILSKATSKGYEHTKDNSFAVLADIQMWLMTEHKRFICIAPLHGKFSYFVVTPAKTNQPFTLAGHNTWMGAYIAAIESALETL